MSQDWSRRRDIDLLADEQVSVDFVIPLAELPRLRPQLATAASSASGHVRFDRLEGAAVAEIDVSACVTLTCQRCLGPVEYALHSAGRVAMVADAGQADRAPAGLETILAPERRLSVRDLVEEELLLALPIVPLHASADCGRSGASSPTEAASGEERHRPFERLDELLKRRQ
ncbi:MAG TPA: YceD family protein [Steroidobacteraceae bacterium]|nr:YceD family protein [Steroidobacteraceae bacterium]